VIFLTAHSEVADKMRGFSAGAVDYVTNRFSRRKSRPRIRTHLELARLRRELALALADREEIYASIVNQALDAMRSWMARRAVSWNSTPRPMKDSATHATSLRS